MSQNNRYSILQINTSIFHKGIKSPFVLEETLADLDVFANDNKFMFKFNNIISSAKFNVIQTNAIFSQIFNILTENDVISPEDLENRMILKKWIVILDFKGDKSNLNVDNETFDQIFKEGFYIKFEDEYMPIHFVNFEKSPSMTKKCQLSFINENIYDALKDSMDVGFPFDKEYELSKVYAYRGLMFTDGYPIGTADELGLNANSVVIVKDNKCQLSEKYNIITAVNINEIDEMLQKDTIDIPNLINALDAFEVFSDLPNEEKESKLNIALKELQKTDTITLLTHLDIQIPKELKDPSVWKRVEQYGQMGEINLFDGAGLIDDEFASEVEVEYKSKRYNSIDGNNNELSSFQIRLPYIKGMIHRCNIKKFYEKYHVTEIEDFLGNKRSVKNIKMLLTVSQFKCASWITKGFKTLEEQNKQLNIYWNSLSNFNHILFVTSQVNKPKVIDNDKSNYQLLHTPKMTMEEFCKFKEQYEEELIKLKFNQDYRAAFFSRLDSEKNSKKCKNENNYLFKLTKKNKDFVYFPAIKSFLDNIADGFIDQYAIGRIAYKGEIRFLAPDLLELLYYAGKIPYDNNKGLLALNKFFAPERINSEKKFEEGKGYTILRNPHLTRNEDTMLMPDLDKKSERYEYFSGMNGAIMINPRSYIAERLSGADYDGDQVRIVKDEIYNKCVDKHFNNTDEKGKELPMDKKYMPETYKEPILSIPHAKSTLSYINDESKCRSVKNSFNSRVGQINNTAFKYSLYAYNENIDSPEIKETKLNYAKKAQHLAILTGIEIDSTKSGEKPKLPLTEKGETQSSYFILYKDNLDRFNTKSTLVDSFKELDLHKLNNAISKRHNSDVTTIVSPSKELANIIILPYLKTIFKQRTKMYTDYISKDVYQYKSERKKLESGLFNFNPKEVLDNDKLVKLIALVYAYNQVLSTISKNNRYYRSLDEKKFKELQSIESILKRQSEYDNIQLFDLCALNLNISYDRACEAIKVMKQSDWIFTLQENRENVLLSILPEINTSDFDNKNKFIDMLCNFSNKGYLLLYYMLELIKNISNNKEIALIKEKEEASSKKQDIIGLNTDKKNVLENIKMYFNEGKVSITNVDDLYDLYQEYYVEMLDKAKDKAKKGRSYQIKDEIKIVVLNKLLPQIFNSFKQINLDVVLKYIDRFKYSYTSTFMVDFLLEPMFNNAKEDTIPQIVLDNLDFEEPLCITPNLNLNFFNNEQSAENLIELDFEGDFE